MRMCLKCSTTRDGEKAEESESEYFQEDPDASKPDEEPEPTEDDAEASGMKEGDGQPQSVCPRCGSAKMMFGVTVRDQGQFSGGTLQVVISGLYGELKANICVVGKVPARRVRY